MRGCLRPKRCCRSQGQVGGDQGDAQAGGGEHHHRVRAAQFGEKFGMSGEGQSGVVDDALLYRSRHQPVIGPREAAFGGVAQGLQHVLGVARIQGTAGGRFAQGDRGDTQLSGFERGGRPVAVHRHQFQLELEPFGTRQQQFRIGHRHQIGAGVGPLRQHHAEIGPDAGGFPGGQGKSRDQGYSSSSRCTST